MALSKHRLTLKLCTLDVSCDTTAYKAQGKYGEGYEFKRRFEKQIKVIDSLNPDVVNLQEVRYEENVDFVKSEVEKKGYIVHSFFNNEDSMSFHNFICVRKDGNWQEIGKRHYWTTMKENGEAYLSEDKNARVPERENQIGDKHGRCIGVSILENRRDPTKKVVVASIHVVPFDDSTKRVQQEACLSLAKMTQAITGGETPIPVVIAGDFNIFNGDRENRKYFDKFEKYASDLDLREIDLRKMIIDEQIITDPSSIGTCVGAPTEIEDPNKIGTFTPWSTDGYSPIVYKQPLGHSKLDAIFATKYLECKDGVTVRPILMKPMNDLSKMGPEDVEMDELRFRLKDVLASDHFLLTADFTFH